MSATGSGAGSGGNAESGAPSAAASKQPSGSGSAGVEAGGATLEVPSNAPDAVEQTTEDDVSNSIPQHPERCNSYFYCFLQIEAPPQRGRLGSKRTSVADEPLNIKPIEDIEYDPIPITESFEDR